MPTHHARQRRGSRLQYSHGLACKAADLKDMKIKSIAAETGSVDTVVAILSKNLTLEKSVGTEKFHWSDVN